MKAPILRTTKTRLMSPLEPLINKILQKTLTSHAITYGSHAKKDKIDKGKGVENQLTLSNKLIG